jgi:hypothetical protein
MLSPACCPPCEYEPAQYVDPAVIDDIAAWLDGNP